MKKKLLSIKSALSKKNKSRYGWLITVVALVEIAMILLISTFSWVETISSIRISNISNPANIDTYTYTDAWIGTGSDYNQPIDLSKYFRASGNVHMASASSKDGKEFFFPQIAKTGTDTSLDNRYRKGTINDKNTNYLSFSFKVKSVGVTSDFYFESVPTFKIGNESVDNYNDIRIALTVSDENGENGVTTVYSYNDVDTEYVVANTDGTQVEPTSIKAFKNCVKAEDSSDDATPLFEIEANKEKTVTLTAWLQESERISGYSGNNLTAKDFSIITGVTKKTIKFVDRTSAFNEIDATKDTWQWVGNDIEDIAMWVKTAQGSSFKMSPVTPEGTSSKTTEWIVQISPDEIGSTDGDLYFYRTEATLESNPSESNCHNYWKGKLSEASSQGIATYTAYGNLIPVTNNTKQGYGTWGNVCLIQLFSDNESVLATPTSPNSATHITLNTKNNASEVEMNYNGGYWKAYIPNDSNSSDLSFSFSEITVLAGNREKNDESTFHITSSATGYWEPGATVKVHIATGSEGRGTVKVSGGSDNATTVTVTPGTEVTLNADANSDYAFEGWYYDDACTKPFNKETASPKYKPNEKGSNIDFYAKFQYNVRVTAKTDDVQSDAGGSVQINDRPAKVTDSLAVLDGGSVTLKAVQTDAQKEDYTFTGWFDSKGNKIEGTNQETTLNITNLNKPINYFAKYKTKEFKVEAYASTNSIKQDGTGGTVTIPGIASGTYVTANVKYTGSIEIKAVAKESSGYKFDGWYSDEACTNKVESKAILTVSKNSPNVTPKVFYAKFVLKTYTVTAHAVTEGTTDDSTGGTVKITADNKTTAAGNSATTSVTHGNTASFIAEAKSGYDFDGWYDSSGNLLDNSKALTYNRTGVTGDFQAYARFKKQGITVYLKINHNYWKQNNEKYYAYTWSGSSSNWSELTDSDGDGIYSFTETNGWTNIIFVRFDKNQTDIKFDNAWDQTVDLEIGKNSGDSSADLTKPCFVLDSKSGDKYTGKWTVYPPPDEVTITFDASIISNWVNEYSPTIFLYDRSTSTAYQMDSLGDSKWSKKVSTDVKYISFYRCNSNDFSSAEKWNTWQPDDRGDKITYKPSDGDGNGSWQ